MWKSQWGGQVIYSHGTTNSKGCMILLKHTLNTKIHYVVNDAEGRFNIVDINIGDLRIVLCNLYAPNADDVDFFQTIVAQIDKLSVNTEGKVIILGDFNTTLEPKDKKTSGQVSHGHPKCTSFLNEFIVNRDMVDIWRLRHPTEDRFTWFKLKPKLLMERIDFILISKLPIC